MKKDVYSIEQLDLCYFEITDRKFIYMWIYEFPYKTMRIFFHGKIV